MPICKVSDDWCHVESGALLHAWGPHGRTCKMRLHPIRRRIVMKEIFLQSVTSDCVKNVSSQAKTLYLRGILGLVAMAIW